MIHKHILMTIGIGIAITIALSLMIAFHVIPATWALLFPMLFIATMLFFASKITCNDQ